MNLNRMRLCGPRKLALMVFALVCVAILWTAFAGLGTAMPVSAASGVTLTPCHVEGVKEELRCGVYVTLTPCHVEGVKEELRCGVYNVFENRRTRTGRKLPLKIVLIPARHPHPDQGPVFYMAGGPGEAATELADLVMSWGDTDEHDVVLV